MYIYICVCFVDKTAALLFRIARVSGYMRKL